MVVERGGGRAGGGQMEQDSSRSSSKRRMPNYWVMARRLLKNLIHRFLDEFERPLPRLKYGIRPDMRHESSWRRQILSRCRAERRISWRGRPGLGLSCLKRRCSFLLCEGGHGVAERPPAKHLKFRSLTRSKAIRPNRIFGTHGAGTPNIKFNKSCDFQVGARCSSNGLEPEAPATMQLLKRLIYQCGITAVLTAVPARVATAAGPCAKVEFGWVSVQSAYCNSRGGFAISRVTHMPPNGGRSDLENPWILIVARFQAFPHIADEVLGFRQFVADIDARPYRLAQRLRRHPGAP